MPEIAVDWVIGVVFGCGVFYAFFQVFTSLAKQYGWPELTFDIAGLLVIGFLLAVTFVYNVGTNYLSRELSSSARLAKVLWVLLMLLPTAVYAGLANKFNASERERRNKGSDTVEKRQE